MQSRMISPDRLLEYGAMHNAADWNASAPPVLVGEPHNVVLAEIATDLHFDQLKRYFAGIA